MVGFMLIYAYEVFFVLACHHWQAHAKYTCDFASLHNEVFQMMATTTTRTTESAEQTLASHSQSATATAKPNKVSKPTTKAKPATKAKKAKKGQTITLEQARKANPDKPGYARLNSVQNHRGFCQVDVATDTTVKAVKSIAGKPVNVVNKLSTSGAHRATVTLPSGTQATTTSLFQALGALTDKGGNLVWSTADVKTLCSKLGILVCESTFGCKLGAGRAYQRGDVTADQPHGHGSKAAIEASIAAVKPDMVALKKLVGIA
jgi:hypothetical protein